MRWLICLLIDRFAFAQGLKGVYKDDAQTGIDSNRLCLGPGIGEHSIVAHHRAISQKVGGTDNNANG